MGEIIRVIDQGIWRGRHAWTIVMEDEHGRAQVSARGETETEAINDARQTFANRRRFSDEEKAALSQSSEALRKRLL